MVEEMSLTFTVYHRAVRNPCHGRGFGPDRCHGSRKRCHGSPFHANEICCHGNWEEICCHGNWEEGVYLNEEHAQVVLMQSPEDADAAWYLDTGASDHMTRDMVACGAEPDGAAMARPS